MCALIPTDRSSINLTRRCGANSTIEQNIYYSSTDNKLTACIEMPGYAVANFLFGLSDTKAGGQWLRISIMPSIAFAI
jgi:hypothetical protein